METKQKKQNPISDFALTYWPESSSPWGLEGMYAGRTLAFSGVFTPFAVSQRKRKKILSAFGLGSLTKSSGGKIDIYDLFSESAKEAWNNSYRMAVGRPSREVGVEHIFLSLLREHSVQKLLKRMKVQTKAAENLLTNYLKLNPHPSTDVVKKIPFEAFRLAIKLNGRKIGSLMLLGALLNLSPEENILQAIFANIGLTIDKLELFAAWAIKLDYDFPKNSRNEKLLYCARQSQMLEEHFGYFYEFPAIETAVQLSSKQTLKDLEHKKALQLLVKAGRLAQAKHTNIITANLVTQAAG